MRRSVQAAFLVVASLSYIAIQAVPAFASHAVTSVTPNVVAPGDTDVVVTINGTGFSNTTGVPTVAVSGTGVTVNSVQFVSPTSLTAHLTVATNAPENSDFTTGRNVTVTQTVGTDSATCNNCLRVGPVISSFTPAGTTMTSSGPQVAQITATGRAFRQNAVFKLHRTGGFNNAEDLLITAPAASLSGCDNATGLCTTAQSTFDILGATPGPWNLEVANTPANGGGVGKAASQYSINGPAPTLTSLSPATLGQGAGGTTGTVVDVVGTNLFKGLTLKFKIGANDDSNVVQADKANWLSTTHVQVPVQVKSGAAVGNRDVVVTNNPPSGATGTCSGCLTVNNAPSVTTVSPSTLGQGAGQTPNSVPMTITGSNFPGAGNGTPTVSLRNPGTTTPCTGVTLGAITVDSTTQLSTTVTVANNATIQSCDLAVINPDLGQSTKTNALAITSGPVLNSVTDPNNGGASSAPQGRQGLDLRFDGSGFHTGANKPGPTDITFSGTGITVVTTTTNDPIGSPGTRLTVNVNIAENATPGARDVTIRNPDDKGQFTKVGAFTVNAGPTITSVTPSALGQGANNKVLSIVGTGFVNSNQLAVAFSPPTGIHVNSVQFVDPQHLNATVSVDAGASPAPTGSRDLQLTNGDLGTTSKTNALTIDAAPSLAATPLTPNAVGAGAVNKQITIDGDGFSQNMTTSGITFNPSGGITVNSVQVTTNGKQILVSLSVDPAAATGGRIVTVTNPDFGNVSCSTNCLTINPAPTVSSINPGSGPNNAVLSNFAVTGTGMANNATVTLQRTGFGDVTMENTGFSNVGGTTQLVGKLHLNDANYPNSPAPFSVAPGQWTVRVTNPDGGSAVLPANCASGTCKFTVTSAPPNNIAISPNEVPVGGFVTVTVNGANFADGTTVDFGPGVLVGTVTVMSPTQLTADINLADANPGNNDVKVINADNASGTCGQCLLISPAPVIDGIDPPIANPTGQSSTFTIFGSGFQSDATVFISSGLGITVGVPVVTSPETIEVSIAVDRDQPSGFRTIRVTNPDSGVAACIDCFEIHTQGFWMDATDGGIFTGGSAPFLGSMGGTRLNKPVVGMAPLPPDFGQLGYWLVASDGGIFTFGAAPFYGSTGSLRLNKPIVGMAARPQGDGYWLVASDGGIFTFGPGSQFLGSMGGTPLNKPVVGMAVTPTGNGYWLVASDGGIFTFGDAQFLGSTGSLKLNQPIVGMAATPDGEGYRFVASDGGVFNFGSAIPLGSLGGRLISAPIVGIATTVSGDGYWLAGKDGHVYGFGDADDDLTPVSGPLNQPVVGIATAP